MQSQSGLGKTRELHNHHMDSTIWNDFRFRDDDIVIGTYDKSGTTWLQQIVGQLIFGGAEGLEHSSFDYMNAHAAKAAPMGGVFWHGGAETFINKGVNGRWRDALPEADKQRYEALALEQLGPACSRWLATGTPRVS